MKLHTKKFLAITMTITLLGSGVFTANAESINFARETEILETEESEENKKRTIPVDPMPYITLIDPMS